MKPLDPIELTLWIQLVWLLWLSWRLNKLERK